MCGRNTIRIFKLTIGRSKYISLLLKVNSLRYEYICCNFGLYSCFDFIIERGSCRVVYRSKMFLEKTAADCDGSWGRLVIEYVMKHPNDALRIAIGIGGMRIVDKELDMMDGYEFMKVINGCSTDNDKISKV